jgi:hypothetical protein
MEKVWFFKTVVNFYQTTWYYTLELVLAFFSDNTAWKPSALCSNNVQQETVYEKQKN